MFHFASTVVLTGIQSMLVHALYMLFVELGQYKTLWRQMVSPIRRKMCLKTIHQQTAQHVNRLGQE